MLLLAAKPLLALSAAALGTWELGLRGEVRGLAGAPPGQRRVQLDLYEIDPVLRLGALREDPPAGLAVTYAPNLYLPSTTGHFDDVADPKVNHSGSVTGLWRSDRAWQLSLTGTGSSGYRVVSPLSVSLPGTAPETSPGAPSAPGPSLQPSAGERAAPYESLGLGAQAEVQVAPRWQVSASAAWSRGGGISPADRGSYAMERTVTLEAHSTFAATAVDALTFAASGSRTAFEGGRASSLAHLTLRWDRQLAPRWRAFLGGGAALATRSLLAPDARDVAGALPFAEVGFALAEAGADDAPLGGAAAQGRATRYRESWFGGVQARYTPYIDTYAQHTLMRADLSGNVGWRSRSGFRAAVSAARATAVSTREVGPSTATAQAGCWWVVTPSAEAGLLTRFGWQSNALPLAAKYQWSVVAEVSWGGRSSL